MAKTIRNFVTAHSHPQSLDSGSTPETFVKREQELGTGHVTVTDHGSLAACRKVYDLAHEKKVGLTPILGMEAYFRDDDCPILLGAGITKNAAGKLSDYCKYFHITMHFMDEEAFNTAVKLLSKADARAERHGSERKPLFGWKELEELGSKNVTMTSGCLIGMVQRHVLDNDRFDLGEKYYQRLKSIVKPGNLYVEVFPHECDKNWVKGVFISLDDGTVLKFYDKKTLKTNIGEVPAYVLAAEWGRKGNQHEVLVAIKNRSTWQDLPPNKITKVEHIEGEFLPNECRPWTPANGDVQAGCNKIVRYLAKKYGDKILIGDDSHYATKDDKIVQDVRLSQSGDWRFYSSYHRQSSDEAFAHFQKTLSTQEPEFQGWVDNTYEWADRFKAFKFDNTPSLPTKFYPEDTLKHTFELIRKHGRFENPGPEYVKRLKAEIELLHNNGTIDLLPYFMIDEEVCSQYEAAGKLTGPGRGSAAGLLLTYLLGITHVDPIKYDLSLDRFITLDRIKSGKLPDIDQDLPSRDILVDPEDPTKGWLYKRFGDHFAQISVDTTLKLKMAVKDVARMIHGRVPEDTEAWCKRFLMPPQGVTDHDFVMGTEDEHGGHRPGSIEYDEALQGYAKTYPLEWGIVQKCLGLARQKSRHACAYVIANKPIQDFIPLTSVSDVLVTQFTAPSVEAAGGLKMDFLVVNSLNDIGECIRFVQQRSGMDIPDHAYINGLKVPGHRLLPWKGQLYDIWDLPEDQSVFKDVSESKTETVFQFNTPGATQWLSHFNHQKPNGNKAIDKILDMAAFTALDRPGPLDMFVVHPDDADKAKDSPHRKQHNMLVEYARRARGEKGSPDVLSVFQDLIPETYAVMVYQEQLQRVYQVMTGCTGAEAEEFRSNIAKKKKDKIDRFHYPLFMEKASARIGAEQAEAVWQFLQTWAKYGFNKSHAVCYVIIAYACAFLKHHFPLEWWCSVLRNADKAEINDKFWKYCGKFVDLPDLKLSGDNFEIQNDRVRAPVNLLHGIGETAHKQIMDGRPYADIQDFCAKIKAFTVANKYPIKKVPQENGKMKAVKCEPHEATAWRNGRSAITRKAVYTLIVAGAMDSLFPTVITDDLGNENEVLLSDRLSMYERELSAAMGKKKVETVNAAYTNITVPMRYQMKKAILPVYGDDSLIEHLLRVRYAHVFKDAKGRVAYEYTRNKYNGKYNEVVTVIAPFVEVEDMKKLAAIPKTFFQPVTVATVAYVDGVRLFKYGENREACEFQLDVAGAKFKCVKWFGTRGVDPIYKDSLKGAIIVSLFSRYNADHGFSIDEIFLVQPPLDHSAEEESPEPKETDNE